MKRAKCKRTSILCFHLNEVPKIVGLIEIKNESGVYKELGGGGSWCLIGTVFQYGMVNNLGDGGCGDGCPKNKGIHCY